MSVQEVFTTESTIEQLKVRASEVAADLPDGVRLDALIWLQGQIAKHSGDEMAIQMTLEVWISVYRKLIDLEVS